MPTENRPPVRCMALDSEGHVCGCRDFDARDDRWACWACGTYSEGYVPQGLHLAPKPTYPTPPVKPEIKPGDVDPVSPSEHRGLLILADRESDPLVRENNRRCDLLASLAQGLPVAAKISLARQWLVVNAKMPAEEFNAGLAAEVQRIRDARQEAM